MASLNHPLSTPREMGNKKKKQEARKLWTLCQVGGSRVKGGVSVLNPSWHHARTLNACPVCPACPACPRRRSCSSGGQAIAALRLHLIRDAGPVDEISPMGTRDLGVKRDDFGVCGDDVCAWVVIKKRLFVSPLEAPLHACISRKSEESHCPSPHVNFTR